MPKDAFRKLTTADSSQYKILAQTDGIDWHYRLCIAIRSCPRFMLDALCIQSSQLPWDNFEFVEDNGEHIEADPERKDFSLQHSIRSFLPTPDPFDVFIDWGGYEDPEFRFGYSSFSFLDRYWSTLWRSGIHDLLVSDSNFGWAFTCQHHGILHFLNIQRESFRPPSSVSK